MLPPNAPGCQWTALDIIGLMFRINYHTIDTYGHHWTWLDIKVVEAAGIEPEPGFDTTAPQPPQDADTILTFPRACGDRADTSDALLKQKIDTSGHKKCAIDVQRPREEFETTEVLACWSGLPAWLRSALTSWEELPRASKRAIEALLNDI